MQQKFSSILNIIKFSLRRFKNFVGQESIRTPLHGLESWWAFNRENKKSKVQQGSSEIFSVLERRWCCTTKEIIPSDKGSNSYYHANIESKEAFPRELQCMHNYGNHEIASHIINCGFQRKFFRLLPEDLLCFWRLDRLTIGVSIQHQLLTNRRQY